MPMQPEVEVTIELDREVEKNVCMTCLHDYVFDLNTREIPEGSHITMYLGEGVATIMYYTRAGSEERTKLFSLPWADHKYHRKEERFMVRNKDVNEYREDPTDISNSEGGGGNNVDAEESANPNGGRSGEDSIDGPVDGIKDVNVDEDYYDDDNYVVDDDDDDDDGDEYVNIMDVSSEGNEADDEAEVQSRKRKRKPEKGDKEAHKEKKTEHGDGKEEEIVPKNGDGDRGTNSEHTNDEDDDSDSDSDDDDDDSDDDDYDDDETDDKAEVQSRKRKWGSEVNAEQGDEEANKEQKTEHGVGSEEEMVPINGDGDRGTNSEHTDSDDDYSDDDSADGTNSEYTDSDDDDDDSSDDDEDDDDEQS